MLNRDNERREEIVYGGAIEWKDHGFGGIARFHGLKIDALHKLIDENFANPEDRQNFAPSISEFAEFMENHPEFNAHGYIVHPSRDDYRVSIEGLQYTGELTNELIADFSDLCRDADDFTIDIDTNTLYSWWD
jgi:hypothetical protein